MADQVVVVPSEVPGTVVVTTEGGSQSVVVSEEIRSANSVVVVPAEAESAAVVTQGSDITQVVTYPVETGEPGPPGKTGDPGPEGPPGPPGAPSAATQYIHYQPMLSNLWVIDHFLNKHPEVTCEDAAGSVIVGSITYLDNNHLSVKFAITVTGRANCT